MAPRLQAPRSAELKKAATLVTEADAACKAGNSAMATEKAKAAMEQEPQGLDPLGLLLFRWRGVALEVRGRPGCGIDAERLYFPHHAL